MDTNAASYMKGLAVAGMVMALVGTASADLIISEVDLTGNKVELVNVGASAIDATSWWWCNRVNGSPFYSQVGTSSTIDTNLSTATSFNVGAGEVLVVDVSSGLLPDANGELGLYNVNSFGSTSAIEDYILWGANGIRDLTAQNAGIWIDDDEIDVSGAAAGETIQLRVGLPGNQASDYDIQPGTLGIDQSLSPSFVSVVIADTVGLCFVSVSGTVYRLEATPDLLSSNSWQDMGTTIVGDGGTNYFFDPTTASGVNTQRFYRIVTE